MQAAGTSEAKERGIAPFAQYAPWALAIFVAMMLIGFIVLDRLAPANRRLIKIRGEDPVAYFGIAHSILFDHDFDLRNEFQHMPPSGKWWTAEQPATGLPGSPWGLGYSFLEIPLLAMGTGVDVLTGGHGDGYGAGAVFCYCLGTVIFAGLGLVALFFVLKEAAIELGVIGEERRARYGLLLTLMVFFGTNVGFYSFSQMAHSATFLFASLFLLVWWRVRDNANNRSWLVLGLIGGMLSICRWQDVLQLGIPLLYDLGAGKFGDTFRTKWRSRAMYGAGVGVWWIPQIAEWKAIYGKYLTVPQSGYFSFPPSHMFQVLFSTQSGWIAWTPLIGLGLAGLVFGAIRRRQLFMPFLIVLALQLVVVGSISFWDGIGSFSARYLLSMTPIVAVGLMNLWAVSTDAVRPVLTAAAVVSCVFVCAFATEYGLHLVPTASPLTFSEYVVDKTRPIELYRRKSAVEKARELIAGGDTTKAAQTLESVLGYGDDRDVYQNLALAYRQSGRIADAERCRMQLKRVLNTELY